MSWSYLIIIPEENLVQTNPVTKATKKNIKKLLVTQNLLNQKYMQ